MRKKVRNGILIFITSLLLSVAAPGIPAVSQLPGDLSGRRLIPELNDPVLSRILESTFVLVWPGTTLSKQVIHSVFYLDGIGFGRCYHLSGRLAENGSLKLPLIDYIGFWEVRWPKTAPWPVGGSSAT